MEKSYVLVEGPMGTDNKTTFVAMFDGEELEILGADSAAIAGSKQLKRAMKTAGKSFDLDKALRGYTYYKKTKGELTAAKEKDFRARFPVSSKTGYQKTANHALSRAAEIRSRAIGVTK